MLHGRKTSSTDAGLMQGDGYEIYDDIFFVRTSARNGGYAPVHRYM